MTYDEMIAIIQAAKDGKVIQVKHKTWDAWKPCESKPNFSFDIFEYRIKPEPREWIVYENLGDETVIFSRHVYNYNPKPIRVREVLED